MWYFRALLIVSFPAWWLTAAICYVFEFYYVAAGLMVLGCAPLLLAGKFFGSFGRRKRHQGILPVSDAAAKSVEFDALST